MNNKNSLINNLKSKFLNLPQDKKLFVIGMALCLLVGLVFLILGNTTYFFYSSVGIVVLYVLFRSSRSV